MTEGQVQQAATFVGPPSASITFPSQLVYHALDEGELTSLGSAKNPTWSGFFFAFLGACISTFPASLPGINAIIAHSVITSDIAIYLIVCCVTGALTIVTGIPAIIGMVRTYRIIHAIKNRPKIQLPATYFSAT